MYHGRYNVMYIGGLSNRGWERGRDIRMFTRQNPLDTDQFKTLAGPVNRRSSVEVNAVGDIVGELEMPVIFDWDRDLKTGKYITNDSPEVLKRYLAWGWTPYSIANSDSIGMQLVSEDSLVPIQIDHYLQPVAIRSRYARN